MQGFKQVVNHVGAGTEVVVNLVNIIDLHGLEGHRNLTCTVEFKTLVAGESVASHTTGTIGEVDLQILIDSEVVIFRSLSYYLLCGALVGGGSLSRCLGLGVSSGMIQTPSTLAAP